MMKKVLSRIVNDYGTFLPLLLLCAYFSWATYSDQSPVGEAAGRQVAAAIVREHPKANVLIAAADRPLDHEFAAALQADLTAAGASVVGVIHGDPSNAHKMLKALAASKQRIDIIACTEQAGRWQTFADVKSIDPALGDPQLLVPQTYRWPTFFMASNLRNIAGQIAVIAIIAVGMTMVIITGGIDLSVGSLIAFSSVTAALCLRDFLGGTEAGAVEMVVGCAIAIAACGVIGAVSGSLIAYFDLPPFIVTLAMMLVALGTAGDMSNSETIAAVPATFSRLGLGAEIPGFPNTVVVMIAIYLAAHILMSRMRLGRYIYAVGGNREAARLSGVPVQRVLIIVYVASALLAGFGGVIIASQFRGGSYNYGRLYEFQAITAVVVGGASLSGGEGTVFGTLIGSFTIAVISNGMNMTGVEPNRQITVLGAVILGAVMLDKLRRGK